MKDRGLKGGAREEYMRIKLTINRRTPHREDRPAADAAGGKRGYAVGAICDINW